MTTLIRMKAEVVNPELPVLTEQGFLPYYTGVYVNRLADKGVTLTQTEINAVTAFVNTLLENGLLGCIGSFYPFMGNPNVPLIGNKELEFTGVTSANTELDFVNGKLRGYKITPNMPNVKYSDLCTFYEGLIFSGSMISTTKTSFPSSPGKLINFLTDNSEAGIPSLQLKLQYYSLDGCYKFAMVDYHDSIDSYITKFMPIVSNSDDMHNFSFYYGIRKVGHTEGESFVYNRTLNRDNVNISNHIGSDVIENLIHSNVENFNLGPLTTQYDYVQDRAVTTLAFFNEFLDKGQSKAFVDALDTFTAAVGKTVSV